MTQPHLDDCSKQGRNQKRLFGYASSKQILLQRNDVRQRQDTQCQVGAGEVGRVVSGS